MRESVCVVRVFSYRNVTHFIRTKNAGLLSIRLGYTTLGSCNYCGAWFIHPWQKQLTWFCRTWTGYTFLGSTYANVEEHVYVQGLHSGLKCFMYCLIYIIMG